MPAALKVEVGVVDAGAQRMAEPGIETVEVEPPGVSRVATAPSSLS
nr:hypothetical protein [Halomonas socia]